MTKWVAHLTLPMLEMVLFPWSFCVEGCFFSHRGSRCHLSDWFLEDYVIPSGCLQPYRKEFRPCCVQRALQIAYKVYFR